jgi:hypothetical protein
MKTAKIDMRRGKVFVRSEHRLLSGAYIIQDDAVTLDVGDLGGIGAAVRTALQAFRTGALMPPPEKLGPDAPKALYVAAGVRNGREFAKGAKSVSVKSDNGQITLISYRNEGGSHFVPIKGHDRIISEASSDADLGAAVIAALADAE